MSSIMSETAYPKGKATLDGEPGHEELNARLDACGEAIRDLGGRLDSLKKRADSTTSFTAEDAWKAAVRESYPEARITVEAGKTQRAAIGTKLIGLWNAEDGHGWVEEVGTRHDADFGPDNTNTTQVIQGRGDRDSHSAWQSTFERLQRQHDMERDPVRRKELMQQMQAAKRQIAGVSADATVRTDPPVSEAQRKAMFAATNGKSNLGISKSVGKEFSEADPGGKLPETVKKDASLSLKDLTPELGEKAKAFWNAGKGLKEIAQAMGISEGDVKSIFNKFPPPRR